MCATSRPRILIADDHVLVAEALKNLLTTDFEVVGTVHDGRSLIDVAQTLLPDVILVDIGMPLLNGLDAVVRIKRRMPDVKVIYVTINHDPDLIAESLRRGANGYLLKSAATSELAAAIQCALRGECYVSPALGVLPGRSSCRIAEADSVRDNLTDRQLEVFQLLAEGRSMKEVAGVLKLTTRTVAFHKYRLMESLNLGNDAEVVQLALRQHMVFT